jgi:alcohol dehydrogenase class IV
VHETTTSVDRSNATVTQKMTATSREKLRARMAAVATTTTAKKKTRSTKKFDRNGKPVRFMKTRSGGGSGDGSGDGKGSDDVPKEKMSKWHRTAQMVASTSASMVLGSSLGRLQHALEKKFFKPGYFETVQGALLGIVFGIVMSLLVLWIFE